jgi:hypothetical protein
MNSATCDDPEHSGRETLGSTTLRDDADANDEPSEITGQPILRVASSVVRPWLDSISISVTNNAC